MQGNSRTSAFIIGAFIFLGMTSLGYLLSNAVIQFKEYERTVTAKGLSEREYEADIVIWPIQFTQAGNDLVELYNSIDSNTFEIKAFLLSKGIEPEDISFSSPAITDRAAQQFVRDAKVKFRYTALQTVTVYSKNVNDVRKIMGTLSELGRKGIVFIGDNYQTQQEYIFTRLNHVKPEMIEESTRNARKVAEKFAADSESKLGKIKRASQGQFSINPRDKNNPHIKKVRVVSTVEYYLSD